MMQLFAESYYSSNAYCLKNHNSFSTIESNIHDNANDDNHRINENLSIHMILYVELQIDSTT